MIKKTMLLLVILISPKGFSQDISTFFDKVDTFFKEHVVDGNVAYSKIHANSETLNDILKLAEGISVSKDNTETYQAFWINAYNLAVIKGIVDHYPINSPLDTDGFFDKITYSLARQKITLNDIENKLLRAQFNDARFHFVLVCGAVGCPPLISKAYLPKTLYTQLETQTTLALNGSFIKVNTKKKRIEVSQIMEWYQEDFIVNGMTEIDFINNYRNEKIPNDFKLSYFPYNWKVNGY